MSAGFIREVQNNLRDGFFLPHQAVIKETNATSKLRVVFDASAASRTGISLNNALLAAPKLQDNIFFLLLRSVSNLHPT